MSTFTESDVEQAALMFTGPRYGELRAITIGQVRLDADVPHIEVKAAREKARRGAGVPLPQSMAGLPGLPEIAQPVNVAAAESTSNLRPIDRRISVSRGAISCTQDGQDRGDVQVGENGKNPMFPGVWGM